MKRKAFSDQLRDFIESSDESRYRIAKETGVDAATLARFVAGERGLSMTAIDALVEYFGLQVTQNRPNKARR